MPSCGIRKDEHANDDIKLSVVRRGDNRASRKGINVWGRHKLSLSSRLLPTNSKGVTVYRPSRGW